MNNAEPLATALLKNRRAAMVGGGGRFEKNCLVRQLCPFLDQESLLTVSIPGSPPFELLQCVLHGTALEDYPEVSTGLECTRALSN